MAVWQFDVEFMPHIIVPDAAAYIDASISDDGLETDHWWRYNPPDDSFRALIARYFPQRDSWNDDLSQWGDEDAVLIESWLEDGILISLSSRVDLRNANRFLIERLAELVADLSCHFYVTETQAVIPPDADLLLEHVRVSRAARFCQNPRKFLEDLGREIDGEEGRPV